VRLHPIRQFLVCGHGFFDQIAMRIEKLHAACEPGGYDLAIFEKYLAFCLALKPGYPWLDRPDSIDTAVLKERELIWIVGRSRHGRRPCIVGKPLNPDSWADAFFKPALALPRKRMRDYALCMRDVGKVPEANHGFLFSTATLQEKRQCSDSCDQRYCFHIFSFTLICLFRSRTLPGHARGLDRTRPDQTQDWLGGNPTRCEDS